MGRPLLPTGESCILLAVCGGDVGRLQGDSSSNSEGSDEEMAGVSGGERSEPGPGGAGGRGGGHAAAGGGAAPTGGAADGATGAGAAAGPASDGAGAKKPKPRRRPSVLAYEEDFIDDADELQYEKKRRVKPKYQGFYVIQVSAAWGQNVG